ncbi:MAG: hypothetical protein VR67_11960 [Peptococcaceae bacterium BRH_c8a]|nr:MAG: hypothetical protein VR67_11960 [Peptococcaceae bacterium BRH_c8a]
MEKTRVIIVSFNGRSSVTYAEDGQFIYIPRRKSHQVGQVLFLKNQSSARHWNISGWKTMIAAAAIVLLVFGLANPLISQPAEAYFSLDLDKSSAEFWLDRDNRVTDMKYKGTSQLTAPDIKGKNIYQAVSVIASKASVLDDYGNGIIIMSFADMTKDGSHYIDEEKLKEAILSSMNSGEKTPFMVMSRHDKGFIAKAGELGLSASQYYVLEQSKSNGLSLTAEQLKNTSIRLALEEAGTTPEELLGLVQVHPDMNTETQRGMMHTTGNSGNSLTNDTSVMDGKHEYDQEDNIQEQPYTMQHQMEQSDETRMQKSQQPTSMKQNINSSSMNQTQDFNKPRTNQNDMY